ncbi:carbohydrate ABC transporter permease [Histidinibacterium aquaticum]|uniref:Sugar ABC transporter permease n=1 Tax=Histidinibacterium aquaticum TaxID=2613962 RepID=A0A5J5GBN1_9RHOB|nr:sugar ABC transporter permease [Histidinibacterium aquaticum]KAA9005536.1 sugar ABC transporter permease [Histidinibacterium aquaticum]
MAEGDPSTDMASATRIVGWQHPWIAYLSSAPAMIIVAVVLAFPVLFAAVQSLYDISPLSQESPFIGFGNYIDVFSEPSFWSSLWRTGIFVFGVIALGLTLSIIFAFALNRVVSGLRFIRGLAILPYIVSSVAAALMFRTMFNSEFGFPNQVLEFMGFGAVPWLSNGVYAMIVVIIAQVWTDLPLALLFILGGLQTIDDQLTEAALVDGATGLRSAIYISIPLIAPQITLATVWLSFKAVTSLGTVLALTGGGPGEATQLLTLEMVRLGFDEYETGTAMALVIIIFVLNAALTLFYLGLQRKFGTK